MKRIIDKNYVLNDIDTNQLGLEISPLFNPVTDKIHHNVHYTDYTSSEESRSKHKHYEHDDIVDIDFIWQPNKKLIECSENSQYQWAVASHVIEHVPDPIGWMLQVFDVISDNGIFSIVLPDARGTYDKHRQLTEVSDLLLSWLYQDNIPNPKQLYGFLSKVLSSDLDGNLLDAKHYSIHEALNFTLNSFTLGRYFDAHCSVFTGDSFIDIIKELNDLGILNVLIIDFSQREDEFYIKLKKLGEPKVSRPERFAGYIESNKSYEHLKKAYNESILAQNRLKDEIILLNNSIISRHRSRGVLSRMLNPVRKMFNR
ncbi:methyltransferase domain-containing protein [Plesiomonas shigelloides]|uniref:methyltransferase domain-containing protein n=1 Tax=Plesiomonas shigelloides TaxID=703 RepID=UPI00057A6467|nr:methyltransferase domain-containing protein [Plesiomonas shigelloides]